MSGTKRGTRLISVLDLGTVTFALTISMPLAGAIMARVSGLPRLPGEADQRLLAAGDFGGDAPHGAGDFDDALVSHGETRRPAAAR
jgi:hypothetical protein